MANKEISSGADLLGRPDSAQLKNQNGGPPEGRIAPLTLGVGGMGAKRPMVTLGEPVTNSLQAEGAEGPRRASSFAAAGAGAKRPLDLSLGHFGTTAIDDGLDVGFFTIEDLDGDGGPDVDYVQHGHLLLVLDHDAHTATVRPHPGRSLNKEQNLRTERRLANKLRRLKAEGFAVIGMVV